MIVEIPNWPLVTLEKVKFRNFFTYWIFSFFSYEPKSVYNFKGHQALFLES